MAYVNNGSDIVSKQRITCLERYGVENPSQCDSCKQKLKDTMLKRYGVEHALQKQEFKDKAKQTCLERYGVENAWNKPEVRQRCLDTLYVVDSNGIRHRRDCVQDKIEKTCYERYGTKNPFQNDDVRQKAINTFKDKYNNTSYMGTSDFVKKSKQSMTRRYGSEHALQCSDIKSKFQNTMMSKYGRPSASTFHIDDEHWDLWQAFKQNPQSFIQNYMPSSNKPTLHELSGVVGVSENAVSYFLHTSDNLDLITFSKSNVENEVCQFIRSLDSSITVVCNSKSIIKPYELDIYLPDYNFAIEVNPTVTHNSSFGFKKDPHGSPLPKDYHKRKTDMCECKNIQLLHIFGYDWSYRKDIIKSIISFHIHKYKYRVYARKCDIRQVDSQISKKFLNTNHLQGSVNSSIQYGLYYENELVSLMCFCKPRKTMGSTVKASTHTTYELVRFCNKLNMDVVGGASKLFKTFLQNVHCDRVISYSDRAHFSGNLYSALGFTLDHVISPGYVWVNCKDDTAYHRINTQKKNLVKFLHDDAIDLSQTEKQIMEDHGYAQVFDSGKIAWVYDVI